MPKLVVVGTDNGLQILHSFAQMHVIFWVSTAQVKGNVAYLLDAVCTLVMRKRHQFQKQVLLGMAASLDGFDVAPTRHSSMCKLLVVSIGFR